MRRLISMAAGLRPRNVALALETLAMQNPNDDQTQLIVVRWAPGVINLPPGAIELSLPGGSRAECANLALETYTEQHGLPEVWFVLDDDMVLCLDALDRLEAILDAKQDIGLIGPWNDCAERDRGRVIRSGSEVVQINDPSMPDFTVGGAGQTIPKRTLERLGRAYDPDWEWLEDYEFTKAVRAAGFQTAVARSIFAVILRDDGITPDYRDLATARHQQLLAAKGLIVR